MSLARIVREQVVASSTIGGGAFYQMTSSISDGLKFMMGNSIKSNIMKKDLFCISTKKTMIPDDDKINVPKNIFRLQIMKGFGFLYWNEVFGINFEDGQS